MSWATTSRQILLEIVEATPQQQGESLEDWGKRLRKAITNGYLFSQRSGFAYKAWCRERAVVLHQLGIVAGLPKKGSKALAELAAMHHPGQLNLF